jgi:L-amino acid N-acyltransferase YncA
MKTSTESLIIRPAVDADIEGMLTLLNEIIRVGGTTAITNELSTGEMREWLSPAGRSYRVSWRSIPKAQLRAFNR